MNVPSGWIGQHDQRFRGWRLRARRDAWTLKRAGACADAAAPSAARSRTTLDSAVIDDARGAAILARGTSRARESAPQRFLEVSGRARIAVHGNEPVEGDAETLERFRELGGVLTARR